MALRTSMRQSASRQSPSELSPEGTAGPAPRQAARTIAPRPAHSPEAQPAEPRTLVISQRVRRPMVARALTHSFEDAIVALDGAELLAPPRVSRWTARAEDLCAHAEALLHPAGRFPPRPAEPTRDAYPLALFVLQDLRDLWELRPLTRWLELAERSAVYVEELWAAELPRRSGEVDLLKRFDALFVGCAGACGPLARLTGRPVHYTPPGVDTLAMNPLPEPPKPAVDIYAMGRRPERTHRALADLAARRGWFYLYDTMANAPTPAHTEHRARLADTLRRTRYFLVNWAKCTSPDEIAGQHEVGFRYFEAAAAGCCLIGDAPDTPQWRDLFGFEDSIFRVPFDSEQVEALIDELERDPRRVAQHRLTHIVRSLRRHDFAHRLSFMLGTLGVESRGPLRDRLALLDATAAEAETTGLGALRWR